MTDIEKVLWLVFIFGAVIFVSFKLIPIFFGQYYRDKSKHLVIITLNSQHRIEWMIWSYKFWQDYTEPKGSITCVDLGSTDDTLQILERLRYRCPQLRIVTLSSQADMDTALKEWLESQNMDKSRLIALDLREFEREQENSQELA